MKTLRMSIGWAICVAWLLLPVACDDDEPTNPGIQPEIVNMTDNFQYQVSNVRNYTGTASYTWQNTGIQATVNQATSVTAGAVLLELLDADGMQVYSRSLAENGTFNSATGVAGAWTVRVSYNGASATVNFRADKTT